MQPASAENESAHAQQTGQQAGEALVGADGRKSATNTSEEKNRETNFQSLLGGVCLCAPLEPSRVPASHLVVHSEYQYLCFACAKFCENLGDPIYKELNPISVTFGTHDSDLGTPKSGFADLGKFFKSFKFLNSKHM